MTKIWFEDNLEAHKFIDSEYWRSNLQEVKEQINKSDIYICVWSGKIESFIGLVGEYVLGLFFANNFQGKGVGTALLRYVKEKKYILKYTQRTKERVAFISQGFVVEQ